MKKLAMICLVMVTFPLTAFVGSPVAHADTPSDDVPPAAIANPQVALDVIRALPPAIQNDPTIVIGPEIRADTPIIYPDGTPVPGLSPQATQKLADCGSAVMAAYNFQWWGPFNSNCALWGNPNAQVSYNKYTNPATNGQACWQAKHFVWTAPNDTWREEWTGIGCQDGTSVLSWGNVVAMPAVKVKAIIPLVGYTGRFTH